MKRLLVRALATLAALAPAVAQAVELDPSESVAVAGTRVFQRPELAGSIANDVLLPFEVRDAAGSVVLSGNLQNRVVTSTSLGTLIFSPRLRDLDNHGSGWRTAAVISSGFAGYATDVDFRLDGVGSVGPEQAERSADGDRVRFGYAADGTNVPPAEALFPFILTDAQTFTTTGFLQIVAEDPVSGARASSILEGAAVPLTAAPLALLSAVLPSSRSVQVGTPATAFATVINSGTAPLTGCSIAPATEVAAELAFQTTDPASNAVTGAPGTAVDLAAGAMQSFVLALTPSAPFAPLQVGFSFDCADGLPAARVVGLTTLLLSASAAAVPDIVAVAASAIPGVVSIPGVGGTGAFAVATVNLGVAAALTVTAESGSADLPLDLSLCPTDAASGACLEAPAGSTTTTIAAGASPTFAVFVRAREAIAFDPAANRVFVNFRDAGGVSRGATSLAVRLDAPQ